MDVVKGRSFKYASVPIRVHENGGGFDTDDISGGGDETMSSPGEMSTPIAATPVNSQCSLSRTSELTISFEGEVYVFPSVTPEKVQAVLLLLGGQETPTSIPSSEYLVQISDKVPQTPTSIPSSEYLVQISDKVPQTPTSIPSSEYLVQVSDKDVDDDFSQPIVSRRIASLERFREKRKGRRFEKKIRYSYTCRKEVAQRMHRKNGQFASVQNNCNTSDDNWDLNCNAPVLRTCENCGVSESSTPAMRRGPAGPRTLCNACGLMWANKGTLRDLTKGGRHTFEEKEPEPLEIKPSAIEPANSYCDQEELAGHGTPEQTKRALLKFGNPSVRTEQESLDEPRNVSGTEFETPTNLDEQVAVDSHIGAQRPKT